MIAEILFGRERAAINQQLGHPMAGVSWAGGSATVSGVPVDEATAMNYSACWAATRWITASISHLPFNLYRDKKGGGKEIAWDHPVHRIIYSQPNPRMSSMMWRASALQQQINAGNCYAEIERTNGGRVVGLHPIHWSRVTIKDGDSGPAYDIWNPTGRSTTIEATEMFHVPNIISSDGITGKGVITAARESIGFGLATERHGGAYFGNGARPSVLLEHPGTMKPDARANLRKEWKEIHGGPDKAGDVAVLWEGMKAQVLSISPEDSQFLGTRQHNVEEMARWYGVPPHKIQHLLRATFNNVEHIAIESVTDCLMPYGKLWEQEVCRKLLTEKEQETLYAKHLFDALLRGDAKTRTEALQIQFMHGNLDLDTWAEIEDRNPIGGEMGKARFVPVNLTTLERAVEGPPEQVTTIQPAAPEPMEEPEDEPADEPDDSEARAAVLDNFRDVVSLMVRKEIEAAERAAKQPGTFLSKVEAFYASHAERMQTALQRPWACVQAVCGECCPLGELIAGHCEMSRVALVEASGVSSSELESAVTLAVTGWAERTIEPLLEGVAA